MAFYQVELEQTEHFIVKVEADSKEDAEVKAIDEFKNDNFDYMNDDVVHASAIDIINS